MTKKSIYTLLSTAILSSGAVFASDLGDLGSPDIKRKIEDLPRTPALQRIAEDTYAGDAFSPESLAFHKGLHVRKAKLDRDSQKAALEEALRKKGLAAKLAEDLAATEAESQAEILALTARLEALKADLEAGQSVKSATEARTLELSEAIARLEEERISMAGLIQEERSRAAAAIEEERSRAAEVIEATRLSSKEDLARMEAAIAKEKASKKEVMAASTRAVEDLEARFEESKRKMAALTAERDDLEAAKKMMEAKERGLNQRISLFENHLGATRVLVTTDSRASADPLPRRASTAGAQEVDTSGLEGAASAEPVAAQKPGGFQLPTASFKPQPKRK